MKVAVFPSNRVEDARFIAVDTVKKFNELKIEVFVLEKYTEMFNDLDVTFVDTTDELISICDIAVSVGGDGTMLSVSKLASLCGKKTIGINAGRLGFMTAIEKHELNLLELLLENKYQVEERMMLKVEIIENDKIICSSYCLNDAVITRGNKARLIDIEVSADYGVITSVRADGIIIATPTGSTAYSMASGGPVVSPNHSCFIVTPISPHSLVNRSTIVDSRDILYLTVSNDLSNNSYLSLDGETTIPLKENTVVKISKSEFSAKLVKVKPDNFYEILKKKIIERRF